MIENEFRVRPVTRYNLTHYENDGRTGGVRSLGEFDSLDAAEEVGRAMHHITEGSTFVTICKEGRANSPQPDFLGSVNMGRDGIKYVMTAEGWKRAV